MLTQMRSSPSSFTQRPQITEIQRRIWKANENSYWFFLSLWALELLSTENKSNLGIRSEWEIVCGNDSFTCDERSVVGQVSSNFHLNLFIFYEHRFILSVNLAHLCTSHAYEITQHVRLAQPCSRNWGRGSQRYGKGFWIILLSGWWSNEEGQANTHRKLKIKRPQD